MFRRNYFRASYLFICYENHAQSTVIKRKYYNAKCPLCTPEGHFVLFAGRSSKRGVLGNENCDGCTNTFFPYYLSTFKRRAFIELLV